MKQPVGNIFQGLRSLGGRLGVINDDPVKGPIRFKALFPLVATIPQGIRERRRRIKQIIFGQIPFAQLGRQRGDALAEYRLAQKNYAPGRRWAA